MSEEGDAMGLFVDRVAPEGELETAVTAAVRANPDEANNPATLARHVAAAKHAVKRKVVTYHWPAIIAGIAIAAVLLSVGIALAIASDNWAADQAMKEATTQGYKAPTSNLPGIATSVIALASAWSGGLVSAVLGGGDS
jgi:hypothetical protein